MTDYKASDSFLASLLADPSPDALTATYRELNGRTPCGYAIERGDAEALAGLLGPNVRCTRDEWRGLIWGGDIAFLDRLEAAGGLDYVPLGRLAGVTPEFVGQDELPPTFAWAVTRLLERCQPGPYDETELPRLFTLGARLAPFIPKGGCGLDWALRLGVAQRAKELLEGGAVLGTSMLMADAMHYAYQSGSSETIRMLLERGERIRSWLVPLIARDKAAVFAEVVHPEVARAFLAVDKVTPAFRALRRSYLIANPSVSLPVLLSEEHPHEVLLFAVACAHPQVIEAKMGEFDAATRRRASTLLVDVERSLPVIDADDIPGPLRGPGGSSPGSAERGGSRPPKLRPLWYRERLHFDTDEVEASFRDSLRAVYELIEGRRQPGGLTRALMEAVDARVAEDMAIRAREKAADRKAKRAPATERMLRDLPDRVDPSDTSAEHAVEALREDGLPAVKLLVALARRRPATALPALALVDSPSVALPMARALEQHGLDAIARAWLRDHPRAAAIALIPTLVGGKGVDREKAEAGLRYLAEERHEALVGVADAYGDAARMAVDELLAPSPPPPLPAKLPAFVELDEMPRVRVRGGRAVLPDEAAATLVRLLCAAPLGAPHPELKEALEACDPDSLATFATHLYERWLDAGADLKEKSVIAVLLRAGGNRGARRLAADIARWPVAGASARAKAALEIIGATDDVYVLMLLHELRDRLPRMQKKLANEVNRRLEVVARRLNLSEDELVDRAAPSMGLDAHSRRLISERDGLAWMGVDAKGPYVLDEERRRHEDLPATWKGRSDFKPVRADWKVFRKDVENVLTRAAARLERAMAGGYRWEGAAFAVLYLEHPILRRVAERVVWATYDGEGRRTAAFRHSDEGEPRDAYGDPVDVTSGRIGVCHAIELDHGERVAWSASLEAHGVVPLFEQIERPIFRVGSEEEAWAELHRAMGRGGKLGALKRLEKRGWNRLESTVWEFDRRLSGATLRARVDPQWTTDGGGASNWTLRSIEVVDGSLGALPSACLSELIYEVFESTGLLRAGRRAG